MKSVTCIHLVLLVLSKLIPSIRNWVGAGNRRAMAAGRSQGAPFLPFQGQAWSRLGNKGGLGKPSSGIPVICPKRKMFPKWQGCLLNEWNSPLFFVKFTLFSKANGLILHSFSVKLMPLPSSQLPLGACFCPAFRAVVLDLAQPFPRAYPAAPSRVPFFQHGQPTSRHCAMKTM